MKFQSIFIVFVLLMTSFFMTGCGRLIGEKGYIKNRSNEYKTAQTSPRMQIPEGYDGSLIQDIMPIPQPTIQESAWVGSDDKEYKVPAPKSLLTSQDSDGISIQYAGEKRWILIDAPKDQVWPYVTTFWQMNSVAIAREDVSYGELETGWVSLNKFDEPLRMKLLSRVLDRDDPQNLYDKFKVNLHHGVRRGQHRSSFVADSFKKPNGSD